MSEKRRVLIAAGGTGGHIVPAAVFGRWMEKHHDVSVTCLSGGRSLEREIYGSFGIEPEKLSLEGSPLGVRSPARVLRRLTDLVKGLGETSRVISRIRPDVCVLFGGYVSLPPLLICRVRKIPVIIHEQNAVAGRVTRLASRWGIVVASGWKRCDGVSNFIPVGIPVREPEPLSFSCACEKMGLELSEKGRVVGVAGGSLGSEGLVRRVLDTAEFFAKTDPGVTFLFLGEAPEGGLPSNVRFLGRRWDLNPFYSICDALICRAGGSTLAEALRWNIPTVVVPWEKASEGHQERNARCFEEAGGGIVLSEKNSESLGAPLRRMLARGKNALSTDVELRACSLLWALFS